jgi:hypothetical protein
MTREELIAYDKWLTRRKWMTGEIISPERAADIYLAEHPLPPAEGAEAFLRSHKISGADFVYTTGFENMVELLREFAAQPQPTAEGAEDILASLIESLGEPDNSIHDHSYEIRPLTVNGKCEWWMFHNGVGSGEPLAQWLQNFATLHAQRIADKMVAEKLKNAPKNCPKAAQCAHVEGGMKCPPNVICPI